MVVSKPGCWSGLGERPTAARTGLSGPGAQGLDRMRIYLRGRGRRSDQSLQSVSVGLSSVLDIPQAGGSIGHVGHIQTPVQPGPTRVVIDF